MVFFVRPVVMLQNMGFCTFVKHFLFVVAKYNSTKKAFS